MTFHFNLDFASQRNFAFVLVRLSIILVLFHKAHIENLTCSLSESRTATSTVVVAALLLASPRSNAPSSHRRVARDIGGLLELAGGSRRASVRVRLASATSSPSLCTTVSSGGGLVGDSLLTNFRLSPLPGNDSTAKSSWFWDIGLAKISSTSSGNPCGSQFEVSVTPLR